jgi:hypothetical protein
VAIERNKGLGSKVNVRGLPSEYTHVSINDLATASGSSGREVEFDIFASEIIQRVTVHPFEFGAGEVTAFLSHLAVKRQIGASIPSAKIVLMSYLNIDTLIPIE